MSSFYSSHDRKLAYLPDSCPSKAVFPSLILISPPAVLLVKLLPEKIHPTFESFLLSQSIILGQIANFLFDGKY